MSNEQKLNELSLEEKKIREILSKRFNRIAYWTLKEGINYFLPVEYKNNFPLQGIISHSLFETIKRDVEVQRLETLNSVEEIKQILNYDPVADFEKMKFRRSELRKAEMRFRNLKRGRSMDLERKLSFDEIKEDRLKYFCSNIKIKPEILIIYIINHIDQFSSEIEIPHSLENIINGNLILPENKNPLETQLNELVEKVRPELNLFYCNLKSVANNDKRNVQNLKYGDGVKVIEERIGSFKILELSDLEKKFFGGEKPPRDIKGGLLSKIVKRVIPDLISNRGGIKIGGQHLYNKYLKKSNS